MTGILYVFLALVGAFLVLIFGMRLVLVLRIRKSKGKPAPQLSGKPGRVVRKRPAALFYFYSPSCGACRTMTPVVKQMSKSLDTVFPVDISRDMETARKFGVMATPTTVLVKKGLVDEILIGPQSEGTLRGLLQA